MAGANCFDRRFHLIVALNTAGGYVLVEGPADAQTTSGPYKVRGVPSSTIELPEGSFLIDFVTEYSYPSRKMELKEGFVL